MWNIKFLSNSMYLNLNTFMYSNIQSSSEKIARLARKDFQNFFYDIYR